MAAEMTRRAFGGVLRCAGVALLSLAGATRAGGQSTVPDMSRATLPGLHHESVAYDAARGRLVVYGGSDSLKGTWAWDGTIWTSIADSASSPPWRYGSAMGYDPSSRRLIMFGGWRSYPRNADAFKMFCDTWAFDGTRWTQVNDDSCITTRVRNNSFVYDTRRQALLLLDGTPELEPDTLLPLRIWRWSENRWTLVDSLGPRRGGWDRGVYDEARSVIVFPVFDGPDAGVWEWNGERWRRMAAEGPAPRHVYGLAYDPRLQRVVLVGGQTFARPSAYVGDAWTWDGARWTALTMAGAPGPRAGGHLVRDDRNGRLLYFGGYRGPPMQLLQEMWVLDAGGWRQLVR